MNQKTKIIVKNIVIFCLLLLVFLPVATNVVIAQVPLDNLKNFNDSAGLGSGDIKVIIGRIVQIFLGFLGIVLVLLIIYGGFLWMTAQGEASKIEKAKSLLKNAIIGLIIVISAYAIAVEVVEALIGATGGGGGATEPSTGSGG